MSILPSLEAAIEGVSSEITVLEDEAAALIANITSIVSGLSDLRYGRFTNGKMNQEVIDSLEGLESVCDIR